MRSFAPAEPYAWEGTSTGERIDGRSVRPEESYCYAARGGQSADRRRLADHDVIDVQSDGIRMVHELDAPTEQVVSVLSR